MNILATLLLSFLNMETSFFRTILFPPKISKSVVCQHTNLILFNCCIMVHSIIVLYFIKLAPHWWAFSLLPVFYSPKTDVTTMLWINVCICVSIVWVIFKLSVCTLAFHQVIQECREGKSRIACGSSQSVRKNGHFLHMDYTRVINLFFFRKLSDWLQSL